MNVAELIDKRRKVESAVGLRERGLGPRGVAHFLDRVVFSFFAEDIELLPGMVFTRLLENRSDEQILERLLALNLARAEQGGSS